MHPQALPQQHHAFSNTAQIPPELGTPVSVASGRHDRLRDFLWRMPTETGQDKLICAPSAKPLDGEQGLVIEGSFSLSSVTERGAEGSNACESQHAGTPEH